MNNLLEVFPFIKKTMLDLEQQNKFLNKVTLTGKINALDVAANLFEFTDKTAIIFDELKIELIKALLDENINKVSNELSFKAQTAIDILIRNLFERTADVGFLSTDSVINNFITTDDITKEQISRHLHEYASKYSVYNEILIFDTQGNVLANLNKENTIAHSNDSILQEALQTDGYIESYKETDIFSKQKRTLLFVQKIVKSNETVGVLCLCFKLEDELQSIFKALLAHNEMMAISDEQGVLVSNINSTQKFPKKYNDAPYTIVDQKFIAVSKKTNGYQGYKGISQWYATAILSAYDIRNSFAQEEQEATLTRTNILSENLNQIIEKANDIIEDIADVIINGELIASKQKVYVLTPILDNLRNISTELLVSIKTSIKNLEHVVEEGLIHDVKMASRLAIDIMDRNLYERANDVRWWALTPAFQEELSQETPNTEHINKILLYINELYTVYTNLFIYDKNKKVIAASHNQALLSQELDYDYIEKTLQNKESQNYYVSSFEPTELYDNKPTYIYSASIVHNGKVVGGIGIVFDAKEEFKAMIKESFPHSKKGFMLFLDSNKTIISSSTSKYKVFETFEIEDKFLENRKNHTLYDFVSIDGVEYIVASVKSKGYREYKNKDNYKNDVFCVTYVEV